MFLRTCLFTALLVLLLFPGSTLTAATVIKMDLQELVKHSETILIAEVSAVTATAEDDGRVYSSIELQIEETLKGEDRKTLTLREIGGRDLEADLATHVPGMPYFEEQDRVLLFLYKRGPDQYVVTGLSQGAFLIVEGPDPQSEVLLPRLYGLHLLDHPGPADGSTGLARDHDQLFGQNHDFAAFRALLEALIEAQQKETLQ